MAQLQLRVVELLPETENTLFLSPDNMSFSGSTDENFEERRSLLKASLSDHAILFIIELLSETKYYFSIFLTLISQDLVRLSVSAHRRAQDPQLSSRHSPCESCTRFFPDPCCRCWKLVLDIGKVFENSKSEDQMNRDQSSQWLQGLHPLADPFIQQHLPSIVSRVNADICFPILQMHASAPFRMSQSLRQVETVYSWMRLIDQVVPFHAAK